MWLSLLKIKRVAAQQSTQIVSLRCEQAAMGHCVLFTQESFMLQAPVGRQPSIILPCASLHTHRPCFPTVFSCGFSSFNAPKRLKFVHANREIPNCYPNRKTACGKWFHQLALQFSDSKLTANFISMCAHE